MLHRFGTFWGGIDLPEEKGSTRDAAISACPNVEHLRAPLAVCGGAPARLAVEPGQVVTAGETLAQATDSREVDILAPVDGTVGETVEAGIMVGRRTVPTPAVSLTPSGEPVMPVPVEEHFDWRSAEPTALGERIEAGGMVSFDRRPEPLATWMQRVRRANVETLVLNGLENEPHLTADHRLLVERGRQIVTGMAILARALGVRRVILAVDVRHSADYRSLLAPAGEMDMEHVALPHKYPIGHDHILLSVLLRREVPSAGRPEDVGAAIVRPHTAWAVCRWVLAERRTLGRVVTLGGQGIGRPGNLFVPFGVPARSLAPAARHTLVLGSPMTGLVAPADAVVSPGCSAVLSIDPTRLGQPMQCIRCGWCRDHCPTRLNCSTLNDFFELGQVAESRRLGVLACIGCGICSYVCPARLPLTERMGLLRQAVQRMQPEEAGR